MKNAFKTMGALLIATNAPDLEADFAMADEKGVLHQFHVEIAKVSRS